jgi:hypothetical protein
MAELIYDLNADDWADILGTVTSVGNFAVEAGILAWEILVWPLQLVSLDDQSAELLWDGFAQNVLDSAISGVTDLEAREYGIEAIYCALQATKDNNFDGFSTEVLVKGIEIWNGAQDLRDLLPSSATDIFTWFNPQKSLLELASTVADDRAWGFAVLAFVAGQEAIAGLTGRGLNEYLGDYAGRIAVGSTNCVDYGCGETVECRDNGIWETANVLAVNRGQGWGDLFRPFDDGNRGWYDGNGTAQTAQIAIDLGSEKSFSKLGLLGGFYWEYNEQCGWGNPFSITIETSTNGTAWYPLTVISGPVDLCPGGQNDRVEAFFDIPEATTRYVRFTFDQGSANYWTLGRIALCP